MWCINKASHGLRPEEFTDEDKGRHTKGRRERESSPYDVMDNVICYLLANVIIT